MTTVTQLQETLRLGRSRIAFASILIVSTTCIIQYAKGGRPWTMPTGIRVLLVKGRSSDWNALFVEDPTRIWLTVVNADPIMGATAGNIRATDVPTPVLDEIYRLGPGVSNLAISGWPMACRWTALHTRFPSDPGSVQPLIATASDKLSDRLRDIESTVGVSPVEIRGLSDSLRDLISDMLLASNAQPTLNMALPGGPPAASVYNEWHSIPRLIANWAFTLLSLIFLYIVLALLAGRSLRAARRLMTKQLDNTASPGD